jgi:hypothetical protein
MAYIDGVELDETDEPVTERREKAETSDKYSVDWAGCIILKVFNKQLDLVILQFCI